MSDQQLQPKAAQIYSRLENKVIRTAPLTALCAAMLTSLPTAAIAAPPLETSADSQMQIVITSGRRPQQLSDALATTEVITRDEIERRQSPDTYTLLESVNGLTLHRTGGRGSVPSLFLRGTRTAQTLILIDGVRFNSPSSGTSALDAIPVDNIDRIEIVKGPMSSLYGADAIGGVIQIFTRKGDKKGAGGTLDLAAGTHEARELSATGQLSFDQGNFHVSLQDESTDGYDVTGTPSISGDNDPFEQRSGSFSSSLYLTDHLRTQLTYLYSDSEIDFDRALGETERSFTTRTLENTTANVTAQLTDTVTLTVGTGYLTEADETLAYAASNDTTRKSANTQIQVTPSRKINFIAGLDYSDEELKGTYYTESRENTGLYAQGGVAVGPLDFSASGRADKNQVYGRHNTHSLGASYRITANLRLSANTGRSFRAPTFDDLFFPGFSNPHLQPERASSKELSLRHHAKAQQWYLTAFETQFEDLIVFSFAEGKPENVNRAEIEGAEIGFDTTLFANTHLNLSAAYTDAIDSQTRATLEGRTQWNLFSELYWQAGQMTWSLDFQGIHGKQSGGTTLPSYGLIGAQVQYTVDPQLTLYADADNLSDKDYVKTRFYDFDSGTFTPYQNSGRTLMIGFKLSL